MVRNIHRVSHGVGDGATGEGRSNFLVDGGIDVFGAGVVVSDLRRVGDGRGIQVHRGRI